MIYIIFTIYIVYANLGQVYLLPNPLSKKANVFFFKQLFDMVKSKMHKRIVQNKMQLTS